MRLSLEGTAALVTGGGSGIGRAAALTLAREGARVVVAGRTQAALDETAAMVRAQGGTAAPLAADVTDEEACRRLWQEAEQVCGPVDVLVNNAGDGVFAPVWELTAEQFDAVVAVNLRSTFLCSQAALATMMPRRRGHIVNVASTSGKKPYARQAAYCAAKAGVIALSKVMALDLRPHGIRVTALCPGAVDTPMADRVHPERDRSNWLRPEDVAEALLALLTLPPHATLDELVLRRFEADPL